MASKKYKKTNHIPELTPEQVLLKTKIAKAIEGVAKAKKKRDDIIASCTSHAMAHESDNYFGEGYAWCEVCGEHFGWYCPKSPDHGCHYFSDNGIVTLNDGTTMQCPPDEDGEPYSGDYETDDCCIFCGAPNERK